MAATRRAAAPLRKIYRFYYHRQREAIAAAQIQAAESPENLGRFNGSVGSPFFKHLVRASFPAF